jgi:hypothetical protein
MSRVITFDKGSKRRMRQIRWKPLEIVSLLLISLGTLAIIAVVLSWEISHDSIEPDTPHLQDRR